MAKEIKKWLTEDGVEFKTLEEANNHEKTIAFQTEISNIFFDESTQFGSGLRLSDDQIDEVIDLITVKRRYDIFRAMEKFYEIDKQ